MDWAPNNRSFGFTYEYVPDSTYYHRRGPTLQYCSLTPLGVQGEKGPKRVFKKSRLLLIRIAVRWQTIRISRRLQQLLMAVILVGLPGTCLGIIRVVMNSCVLYFCRVLRLFFYSQRRVRGSTCVLLLTKTESVGLLSPIQLLM